MDELEYEVLSCVATSKATFRPRDATREAEAAFLRTVSLLHQLRERGLIRYLDGHVAKRESGPYLMVGPVQLTAAGQAALARDRSLGERPPRSGDPLPWRS